MTMQHDPFTEQQELTMDLQKPINRPLYDWEKTRDAYLKTEISHVVSLFHSHLQRFLENAYRQGHIECERLYEARAKAFLVNKKEEADENK